MNSQKAIILIPARYDSSRFPGKPLALLKNKSMIQRVFENLSRGSEFVAVVTDDDRIETAVKEFGGNVVRVDDDVPSGSERIKLAYERYFSKDEYALIVNVQGDEPLLKYESVQSLIDFHLKSEFDIGTLVRKRSTDEDDFQNSNCVKAIYNPENGKCLSFSRASVPFQRNPQNEWFHHLGVYSYRPESLRRFCNFPQSYHEKVEGLEQLRALENGLTIGARAVSENLIGVDTPEDIKRVEELLSV